MQLAPQACVRDHVHGLFPCSLNVVVSQQGALPWLCGRWLSYQLLPTFRGQEDSFVETGEPNCRHPQSL